MDIGVYISELLAANGEISVPGLGFLVLQKVPGHYNESDGKFYPPRSEVKFDPQQIDDDETLAQYIAEQKNISLSSAKYFAEKYIASIREDALVREVQIGDAGSFVADQGRLIFIPGQKSIANPAFFGLTPVNLPKTLPSPAPITAPPPATEPEKPSYSNFTAPPPRPAEPQEQTYQSSAPYTPPADTTPPPSSTPPPATSNRDKQALIDAFNASNKGAYSEQGPPIQVRPDLYPPMTSQPKASTGTTHTHDEDEEARRPIALYVLIGVIILLALGVFALKKFMPAKFEALKGIFSHKTTDATSADGKTGDTVKIKEPTAVIPPPKLDSAAQVALDIKRKQDSIKNIATTDSLRKAHKADSIKNAKQMVIDAKKRRQDSLANVKINQETERKRKADSITNAKAEKKRLAAAELAAKKESQKNKSSTVIVTPAPVTVPPVAAPAPVKDTKIAAPTVQKTVTTVPVSSGDLTFATIEPGKTWFAVAGPGTTSASVAEARIAALKKMGIEAFAVRKAGATIFVAMGAYAKNSEADAASTKFKQSGVADAYITQILK